MVAVRSTTMLAISAASASGVVLPPVAVNTAIGGIAGGLGALAVYPLDFIKTQLQSNEGAAQYEDGPDAFVSILRRDGPLALYKGVGTQIAGVAPEKTIKLLVNDAVRGAIRGSLGFIPLAGEVAAGFAAGTCQVLVTNPLEVVKVRLQTSGDDLPTVLAEVGAAGLFIGAGACVARDATFSAILFPAYAHLKPLVADGLGVVGAPGLALAGLLAAAPAAAFTTPADVVKTIQQASREQAAGGGGGRRAITMASPPAAAADASAREVVAELVQAEGLGGLYRGALERVLRSAPQFAITLSAFDMLRQAAVDQGLLTIAG